MNEEISLEDLAEMAAKSAMNLCESLPREYSVFVAVVRPDEQMGIGTNQRDENLTGFLRRLAFLLANRPILSHFTRPIIRTK